MKPVIENDNAIYYVSQSDMLKFIEENKNCERDVASRITREIFNNDSDKVYYDGKIEKKSWNSEPEVFWINNFFDAHPFMKKIMFVFDD